MDRNDFPIFKKNSNLVYLDSAATSQKPLQVIDAVVDFYSSYNANIHRGIYPLAERATEKVEEVREKVRKFINARSTDEIIFTKSTTEAMNLIASTWGKQNIAKKDSITVPISEHHANFVPWQQLCLMNGAQFQVLEAATSSQLHKDTKLVAFSQISNVLGNIIPVKEYIRKLQVENKDIRVVIDAAQSVPHMKIDVQDMDCDFLAFSGHKMLAETGIGILYVKKELLTTMSPFLYGGHMISEVTKEKTTFADSPARFEAGTQHISGIISLGAAIDYLEEKGLERIQKHDNELMSYALSQMKKLDGLHILGTDDKDRSSIISFTMDGIHPHDIAQLLGDNNICVRAGHHCTMPLHKSLGITASARVSFYLYNTEQDVDALIKGLKKVIKIFNR